MTLSTATPAPIGIESFSPRLSLKYNRKRRAAAAIQTLWWLSVLLFVVAAMVSSFSSRHFSSTTRRSANNIFCSGWTIQPSLRRCTRSASPRTTTTSFLLRKQNLGIFFPLGQKTDTNAIGFRRASISTVTSASALTPTTLFMVKAKTTHKWEVGDLVQILPKTTSDASSTTPTDGIQKGEIVSIRGGGWYSVRLLATGDESNNNNNTTTTIKCRGTRLEQLAFDINDGKALPNPNAESKPRSSVVTPTTAALPDALLFRDEMEDPLGSIESHNDQEDLARVVSPAIFDLDAHFGTMGSNNYNNNTNNAAASSSVIEPDVLEQAAHHATYEHWVAFTDLHCSPSTLDTCLEVLDIVHQTALQHPHKCGVLFLGDFWHHRGTLRVDCLNAILGALSEWTVPLVMIPGNHDQVTLEGDNHGLTPLANAYRVTTQEGSVAGPLILSRPTLFREALFVPHIRNAECMKSVVGSEQAQRACALFLHAEVRGAMMNDRMVSTNGISPSVFPRHKHIYSGHFHKPHIVESSTKHDAATIEYLGSPYQVSLAEAHQQKQLVVLDEHWNCQKRVPISVGRRHFKLNSVEELQNIRFSDKGEAATPATSICVKKGDRIVVTNPKRESSETDSDDLWKSHVQSLREQGLMVEVREAATNDHNNKNLTSSTADNSDALGFEELSPEAVWKAYLEDATLRDSVHSEDECKALLKIGLEILEEIETEDSSSLSSLQSSGAQRDLRLTSLSVAGFGPFEDTIDYPLDNRGLILLRGSNSDCGPDSNGTGKSSLAMATLWAFTGSLDARPASDLKVADVVNDNSKVAKVTIRGFINDIPFEVTRSKTASRGGDLTFTVNDEDMTTQSVKETQAVLEEKLGVDTHILTRVAFYGQHGMNDLLEATDSKLKEELSIVVPLELWQQATSLARAKSRQARKKVDEIEGMMRLRKSDIDALSMKVERAKQNRDFKQRSLIEAKERIKREITRMQDMIEQTSSINVEDIQTQLDDTSTSIQMLSDRHALNMKEKESHLKPLEDELMEARDILTSMTRESTQLEMNEQSAKQSIDSARMRMTRVQEKWSLDVSREIPSVLKAPEYCPTCKQPLRSEESGEVSEEHLQNVQKTMETEIREAQTSLALAKDACKETSVKASECLETLHKHEVTFRDLQSNGQKVASEWNSKLQELQDQLAEKRRVQNTLTSQLSTVVKESQLLAAKESALAAFNAEKLNASHADEVYKGLQEELDIAQEFLGKIKAQQKEEENRQALLSSTGERFGQKGVQTFLLQNTVDSLQATAQIYLSRLSEDSQRLDLSLDAGDKILRSAYVRGADGDFRQRPLSTLSGGQWRRCSLALSFAFAELVASRGRLRSSLLVLDEPLTHLDRSGRARFGELVRGLLGARSNDTVAHQQNLSAAASISTAIVILQDLSAEELEESFDGIDTVIRKDGKSCVTVDEMTIEP